MVCSRLRLARGPVSSTTRPASMSSCTEATTSRTPSSADPPVAELDDLVEVVAGVDVHHRERQRAGQNAFSARCSITIESLPPREQQDRPLELGGDLADDVDRLGLEGRAGGRARRPSIMGRVRVERPPARASRVASDRAARRRAIGHRPPDWTDRTRLLRPPRRHRRRPPPRRRLATRPVSCCSSCGRAGRPTATPPTLKARATGARTSSSWRRLGRASALPTPCCPRRARTTGPRGPPADAERAGSSTRSTAPASSASRPAPTGRCTWRWSIGRRARSPARWRSRPRAHAAPPHPPPPLPPGPARAPRVIVSRSRPPAVAARPGRGARRRAGRRWVGRGQGVGGGARRGRHVRPRAAASTSGTRARRWPSPLRRRACTRPGSTERRSSTTIPTRTCRIC